MLTGFVLANVAIGGLAVMTSPLLFRGLLELHYPPTFRGEASGALDTVCVPQRPRISRVHARAIPLSAHSAGEQMEAMYLRTQDGA